MSETFKDIEGVEIVVDDLRIWGETEEQHDSRLERVLQRAKHCNLKLNKGKSQIKCKGISYVGHIIGEEGLKPDPKKIEAVVNMEAPKTRKNCRDSSV